MRLRFKFVPLKQSVNVNSFWDCSPCIVTFRPASLLKRCRPGQWISRLECVLGSHLLSDIHVFAPELLQRLQRFLILTPANQVPWRFRNEDETADQECDEE